MIPQNLETMFQLSQIIGLCIEKEIYAGYNEKRSYSLDEFTEEFLVSIYTVTW